MIYLTHLRLVNYTSPQDRASLNNQAGVVLPQLRVFEYLHEGLQLVNFHHWDLPSLTHLHIGWISDLPTWQNTLDALLSFGKKLKSLSLHNSKDGIAFRIYVTGTLWQLCPKLEQLSCRFGQISGPPTGHPIKHLVIENGDFSGVERVARNLIWPSLQRVTFSRFSWKDLFHDAQAHLAKSQGGDARVTTRVAGKDSRLWVLLEAGVPLFDSNGEMLQAWYKERE